MIPAKNLCTNRRYTVASSLSNRSEQDVVDYNNKQPVGFISDKCLKEQLDNNILCGDYDGHESEMYKSDKVRKQQFMAISDHRVIDRNTFKRLKNKAVVVTAEDRRRIAEDLMADRERLENESAARKQKLQSYDVLRTKGKQLAQVGHNSDV